MKMRTCMGLSQYDMKMCFYYLLTVLLCITVNCIIKLHEYHSNDTAIFSFMVLYTFSNFSMYVLGFLAGIVIARSTANENLESLTEIKSDPAVKSDAVGDNNTPHSVI